MLSKLCVRNGIEKHKNSLARFSTIKEGSKASTMRYPFCNVTNSNANSSNGSNTDIVNNLPIHLSEYLVCYSHGLPYNHVLYLIA